MEESGSNFKINGDYHDISKPWKDELNKTVRDYGVSLFIGAVGTPIIWNLHAATASKERFGVGKCITSFIGLCGSETVRTQLRKVESNEIPGVDLSDEVNKLRYIVTYYNELTAPNDYKDGDISAKIEELKYQSTGKSKIYDDVVTYLDKFQAFQDELQDQAKLSDYKIKNLCVAQLSKAHESLLHALNMAKIRSAAYTFENMKTDAKELALNIKHNRTEYTSTYSANTTVETGSAERQMQEIVSQRNFQDRDYAHESSVNSFERGHRRRSDSRGRYPDSGHSEKTSFSRNDRAPYSSSSYTQQRGRSPSADRYSSNSYGTPQNQRRSVSRDRSRSRDRNNNRGNFSRSSNSSVRSYRESEIIEEAARILQRSGKRN
jgi:hypothetical protein